MLEDFQSYIRLKDLCVSNSRVILAISGGIDSVVMAHLFFKSGYSCIVAHCNFGLRGEESDGDEAFVRSLASGYDYPVLVRQFETHDYARENSISVQMAARDLRYKWFEEIATDHGIDQIATAHNLNDSVETTLINLSRGTGLKGLTGIPVINKKYIRPLLFASRKQISDYAKKSHLAHREDSSNASTKYQRNKIRHEIIPVFEKLNPSFIHTMNDNMVRFAESHEIYRDYVIRKRNEIFFEKETHLEIDLQLLKKLQPRASWLYELFNGYGFSRDQCLNIEKILDSASGKQFVSPTHRLFKDRDKMLLYKSSVSSFERYYIDSPDSKAVLPFALDIEVMGMDELGQLPDSSNIACLDLELLQFPLIVRKWQHGDYFFPLGMDHMKKVSDFFIDNKVPVPVKESAWILTSGPTIVWIIGFRIDNRFKITDKTQRIVKLQLYEYQR